MAYTIDIERVERFYFDAHNAVYSICRPTPLPLLTETPMEPMQKERMLASPADAEIILRLYDLRRETVMRQARAWVVGEFWPATADEYFAVAMNAADPHSPFLRQVVTYWEMAAALVLHGSVSAELFVDCNAEGFVILAKFAPILDEIRQRSPTFLSKTSDVIKRYPAAAGRYDAALKNVEATRSRRNSAAPHPDSPEYAYPQKP